jgi:hypothetical protein
MNTLWAFGDSMTFGYGCRVDGPGIEYYNKYYENGDDVWVNIVAKEFNYLPNNLGICGASNDTIIDTIIDNFDKIKKGDCVIIGKTFFERFDVPNKKDNKLEALLGEIKNYDDSIWYDTLIKNQIKNEEEVQTLINFIYYYGRNTLYEKRQNKRYDFIEKVLKEKNILTFQWKVDMSHGFEKIIHATNKEIKDYHLSFKGHKDFALYLIKRIENNGNRFII